MSLEVWTARVSTRDPDVFDVTRKTGHFAFAPSWALLCPLLDDRRRGVPLSRDRWKAYVEGYLAEMTASYRERRAEWSTLLSRKRVVLTCYCSDERRCHRTVLAKILERLGANYRGELSTGVLEL
jgi:hypothetical protein